MKRQNPSVLRYTESSILVQFQPAISEYILEIVLGTKELLLAQSLEVKLQVITAYNSLLVIYPYAIEDFYSEKKRMLKVLQAANVQKRVMEKRILLPVCYDPSVAPDLELVSEQKNLEKEEIISIHTAATYRVYMIGFLPGFPYLGGLDKRLEIPRKEEPRNKVAAGSVGIAGNQTGIYPRESPGGWQIIGRCPIPLFDPLADPPCSISPGDIIKFREISLSQFEEISRNPSEHFPLDYKGAKPGSTEWKNFRN